jgi:hypothetical protein
MGPNQMNAVNAAILIFVILVKNIFSKGAVWEGTLK